jgi:hypothetical protein
LALAGCYSYSVTPTTALQPGQQVRVRVSSAEAARLEHVIGEGTSRVDGKLLEQNESSITLAVSVPWTTNSSAAASQMPQRIVIPLTEVRETELKRRDEFRTGLLVTAALGVILVVIIDAAAQQQ